jgi:acetoin utilization protein AcuB
MLVKDCMTRHPILIAPTTPASEAQKILVENKVRHLPVVGDGKRLLGLVTHDSFSLRADTLGSLNVWEITRRLGRLTAEEIMRSGPDVITIEPDRTIERAARILAENKLDALPVVEDGDVVIGLLSEVDLLRAFQEMLGLPAAGVRVTVRMPHVKGEFIKLMKALSRNDWGVMGVGSFPTPRREGFYDVVLKIPGPTAAEVEAELNKIPDQEVVDVRTIT